MMETVCRQLLEVRFSTQSWLFLIVSLCCKHARDDYDHKYERCKVWNSSGIRIDQRISLGTRITGNWKQRPFLETDPM